MKSATDLRQLKSLLGDFENPEEPECPEGRQAKAAGPFVEVDPENLEDGTGDDDRVESANFEFDQK